MYPGSFFGRRAGFMIWSCTTPSTVLRPSPSFSDSWNALSRSGPTVPLVPARASVWHAPQFLTNSCLPATTSRSLDSLPHAPTAPINAAPISTLATCRALNRSLPIGPDSTQRTGCWGARSFSRRGRAEALGPDELGSVAEVHQSIGDGLHECGRAADERLRPVGRRDRKLPEQSAIHAPPATRPCGAGLARQRELEIDRRIVRGEASQLVAVEDVGLRPRGQDELRADVGALTRAVAHHRCERHDPGPAGDEQQRATVPRSPREPAADGPAQLDLVALPQLVPEVPGHLAVGQHLDRE